MVVLFFVVIFSINFVFDICLTGKRDSISM